MATYLERYQRGEHEAVWRELTALGAQVGEEPLLTDAYTVACETMQRVRANIQMLIPRLEALGYQFGIWEGERGYQAGIWEGEVKVEMYSAPLVAPSANTMSGIARVERELGVLPLSLRAFAEIVGSVDFRGHHPEWATHGILLDPLVVDVPFDRKSWCNYVIKNSREHIEDLKEYAEDLLEGEDQPFLDIAPDAYHKDNISGGPPYEIVVGTSTVDGQIRNLTVPGGSALGEVDEPFFVPYLRDCLQWGGFPGFAGIQESERLEEQLASLTQGLQAF